MIGLRIAAVTAALVTIVLNAVHGFRSTPDIAFAAMFAALYAALDIGKCTALVAASHAWRQRAHGLAAICAVLFIPLMANSVLNAVAVLAHVRDTAKATETGAAQSRSRTDATYQRLTRELALLQASAQYTATTACTAFPKDAAKARDLRAFCTKLAETQAALTAAGTTLDITTTADPEPHITLLASVMALAPPHIRFGAALLPVLLAELLGSLGFYISSRIKSQASSKPVERVSDRPHPTQPVSSASAPAARPGPSEVNQASAPPPQQPAPVWPKMIRLQQ